METYPYRLGRLAQAARLFLWDLEHNWVTERVYRDFVQLVDEESHPSYDPMPQDLPWYIRSK